MKKVKMLLAVLSLCVLCGCGLASESQTNANGDTKSQTEDNSAEKSIKNKVDSIIGVANNSMSDIRIGSTVSGLVGDNPVQNYQIGFDAQFSTLNDGFERLLSLVGQYLPDISSNINRPLVLDGNAVAVGISRKIDTQLGKMSIAKGRGNV